jgi:SAM-dependent methyltransferase
MSEMYQQAYKNDFEKFLSHTNEKEMLLEEILHEIEKHNAKSLLDIGAGNGLLSIPLSKRVERYVAIESKKSFVEKLQKAGLEVIHDSFPCTVQEQFDIVLSSHSLSYSKDNFEPYVRSAWERVTEGGELLIITYRGEEDDWTLLMKGLDEDPIDRNKLGYANLLALVKSLGKVELRKVKTIAKADSLEDMIEALSFVASDGIPEKKKKFLENHLKLQQLLAAYKVDNGFEFPFWHYVISTSKKV